MVNSVVNSVLLFGASAYAAGSAYVVNKCSYDVYLCNVPAAGGGYDEADKTLSSGETWSQQYTELTNKNGWSIKLSESSSLNNILQYEYTFHDDGIIWYDLSCVNGNPWDGNWEITSSTDSCVPRQAAYRYATDDAYGMQSCPDDASITVTLCSGEAADNGTYSGSESSSAPAYTAPAYSAPAETSSEAAPAAYTTPAAASVTYGYNWNDGDVSSSLNPTPTTFETQVTAFAFSDVGDAIVEIETVFVTDIVTAYAAKPKRHAHHKHRHAA